MSAHAGTIDHHHDHTTTTGIPNKKLFMWAFLASDCMFFGALISTHVIYRLHPTPEGTDPTKIFSIELTSFSTFILLMSSLLMALAVGASQKGKVEATRKMILGTIFFGLIFLGCQVYEFTHFVHSRADAEQRYVWQHFLHVDRNARRARGDRRVVAGVDVYPHLQTGRCVEMLGLPERWCSLRRLPWPRLR